MSQNYKNYGLNCTLFTQNKQFIGSILNKNQGSQQHTRL